MATDAPPTILVVDDNEANRELARATLEDEGFGVVLANGGAAGIAAFEAQRPDCVLLDVRMPDLDGFAVCARIRALPGGRDTPVIFVTAQRDVDTFDRAQVAGGDDFLTKPVRPSELLIRVRAALELRRVTVERDDLVRMLRRQRDDLTRAVLHGERLAAFLVHDLKNPVGGMQVAAEIILKDTTAAKGTLRAAELIHASAQQLDRMILDLLDISKSDAGALSVAREPVDLSGMITGLVDTYAERGRKSHVALQSRVDAPTVRGDAGLLRRVVENLLENAIRHAPRESTVTVETSRAGDFVTIGVRDQGPGVPPELREMIFDRFVQADANGAGRGGRGLGLAFCKLVVDAHGGRIAVEDASPGALFVVSLPDVP